MAGENVVRDPLITGSGYVETGSFLDIKSGAEFRVAGVDITSQLASLGQEDTFANVSGGDYTAPLLVYIDGYDATLGYDTIAAADMSDLNTRAMYIIVDDIAYGATGTAYKFRQATGLNTNAYTVDDKVYLQSSGAYSTAPAGTTDVTQEVGVVRVKSTTVGVIDFYPGAAMVQGIEATDIKGLTASSAELNVLDGVTGGTVLASLGVVVDGSKDIGEFGTLTAATLSRDSNDLTVSSTTTGSVLVDGIDGVEVNSASGDINIGNDAVTGAVNLGTGAAARPIAIGNAASASLAVEGGVGGIDIDCDTTFDVLAGGAFSIDGTGASNVTAASGALTLATTTSGDIFADSAANIMLSPASGSTVQVQDGADNLKVLAFDASNITPGNTRALAMADENVSLVAVLADNTDGEICVQFDQGVADAGTWTPTGSDGGLKSLTRTAANAVESFWAEIPIANRTTALRGIMPTGITANYAVDTADLDDVRFELWKVTQGADGAARTAAVLFGEDNADYDTDHNTPAERGDDSAGPELHRVTVTDAGTPAYMGASETLLLRIYCDGDAGAAGVLEVTSVVMRFTEQRIDR